MFQERTYRRGMLGEKFGTFSFSIQESDLFVGYTPKTREMDLVMKEARRKTMQLRNQILNYPDRRFLSSFIPLDNPIPSGHSLINTMILASGEAKVGPMASVAGAIAQEVGVHLKRKCGLQEIVIENGGDLYLDVKEPILVKLLAPGSGFSGHVAIRIKAEDCPLGVCTSSGKTGPSFSFGRADAVMVACHDSALSDAYATAFCNQVTDETQVDVVIKRISHKEKIISALVVCNERLALYGRLEVEKL
ncbi:MAG: UPF0280 family protein [Sphaerochaetaceae bacterium]